MKKILEDIYEEACGLTANIGEIRDGCFLYEESDVYDSVVLGLENMAKLKKKLQAELLKVEAEEALKNQKETYSQIEKKEVHITFLPDKECNRLTFAKKIKEKV